MDLAILLNYEILQNSISMLQETATDASTHLVCLERLDLVIWDLGTIESM